MKINHVAEMGNQLVYSGNRLRGVLCRLCFITHHIVLLPRKESLKLFINTTNCKL